MAAKTIRERDAVEQDTHTVSEYHPADYLPLTEGERYLYNGEFWQTTLPK